MGIGPGSVCTTRIQTGVGYPQLSAVIECADAAHGLGGHIIADGGCTCPGDIAKAFAGGADFVMLGGMLAGHVEGGGEVINKYYETNEVVYEVGYHLDNHKRKVEVKKFVKFYGMSSDVANTKHFGGLKPKISSFLNPFPILWHTVVHVIKYLRPEIRFSTTGFPLHGQE